MSGVGLHSHDVSFLEVEVVAIVVVSFSGVLELYFDKVGCLVIARHVGQPVEGVQLAVLSAASLVA